MITSTTTSQIATRIAKFSFILYLVTAFFGTSLPFQDRVTEVDDIGTSNKHNQIIFSTLFCLSALSLIPVRDRILDFIRREKFLCVFLAWCFISIAWSDYSLIAFKRLSQIFMTVVVFLAALLHSDLTDDILKYFKYILAFYILITLFSIALVPAAIDPAHNTWRGLASTKNHLGQVCLISTIIWFSVFRIAKDKERRLALLMVFLSVVLLIGSGSMTATLVLFALAAISVLLHSDRLFFPLGLGRAFSVMVVTSCAGLIISFILFAPDTLYSAPEMFGRDMTFTGRTDLWADVFRQAQLHVFQGTGFGSFWVIGNEAVMDLYETYVWLPRQAHMGYMDLFNELGIVGICLFAVMIISYFRDLGKQKGPHYWNWIILAVLMINLQETTLFKPRMLTGTLFIFAYLASYTALIKQDVSDNSIARVQS